MLTGRIFDDRGNLMSPSHTTKKGVRYRYYISTPISQGRTAEAGSICRVSAPEVEAIVADAMGRRTIGPSDEPGEMTLLDRIDLRVSMHPRTLEITWKDERPSGSATQDDDHDAIDEGPRHRVSVPYAVTSHKRRRDIILPTEASAYIRPIEQDEQHRLVRSIAQGKAWLREILAGATTPAIALREQKSERTIRLTLSLAFLDPKLVKAALQGSLPRGVSTRRLLDAPADWHEQWRGIGLARPA